MSIILSILRRFDLVTHKVNDIVAPLNDILTRLGAAVAHHDEEATRLHAEANAAVLKAREHIEEGSRAVAVASKITALLS